MPINTSIIANVQLTRFWLNILLGAKLLASNMEAALLSVYGTNRGCLSPYTKALVSGLTVARIVVWLGTIAVRLNGRRTWLWLDYPCDKGSLFQGGCGGVIDPNFFFHLLWVHSLTGPLNGHEGFLISFTSFLLHGSLSITNMAKAVEYFCHIWKFWSGISH